MPERVLVQSAMSCRILASACVLVVSVVIVVALMVRCSASRGKTAPSLYLFVERDGSKSNPRTTFCFAQNEALYIREIRFTCAELLIRQASGLPHRPDL